MRIIVIGGGWAGCAAALQAKKCGAEVLLIEKTDLLLGLGNVGGIIRNNGRFTAAEEMIALGGGDLFKIADNCARHKNVDFPGHKHATLYDVNRIEPEVRNYLYSKGVNVIFETRVVDVGTEGNRIKSIYLFDGTEIEGDVFVETTGSTGPIGNCLRYGQGCSMCILRCPSYGPRISISMRAGVEDIQGLRGDESFGAMSGSCKLVKETLSEDIQEKLNKDGVVVLPVPKEDINVEKLNMKVCQQYALKEFAENIVLLDTGHAKLMTSYYPLEKLRKIPGLEKAKFVDPYSGGKANSIRYLSMAPRENTMKVCGLDNLFVGGEKSGLFVGHTEAIVTGTLAGYNAVRAGLGLNLVELPITLAVGDIINHENEMKKSIEGLKLRYTFAGANYFERMKKLGLYTTNVEEIRNRVRSLMLEKFFETRII
ncbi:tRNA uridine 5-carboxymethylaminomethyl modification enzyme MnmG [Caloramator mitchellensis]|uniref:tRNA uridine 5-carboxymethylaminomethyl modification enzyme MnmG n=1 Tax=Caloramator mitchellensis TaxID=908809 RepID=A0A0R3K398_CALMK|nr:FAD-dependent oxidoreductase [Caloramator mitchellensis]KRQ86799.1 tRNA uridine 5-carboxymethylaminomethyl modification enzyme MnmG [Caloramator mitchellensis]